MDAWIHDGPHPIVCRGHSGGRLLCQAYVRNGIRMGVVTEPRYDTEFFSVRTNPAIREIILNAYNYFGADDRLRRRLQALMREAVSRFVETEICHGGPFGWKLGATIFTLPVVLDAFPTAKVVHLIRDGRDVMLSRLNARIEHLDDPVNRLMVFGDPDIDSFEGRPLTPRTVEELRTELEMQHWVTAVEYGLLGRRYAGRYLEVYYEQLCARPVETCERTFSFLGVPLFEATKDWLARVATTSRIGKWRTQPPDALARALQIGRRLLTRLGYV